MNVTCPIASLSELKPLIKAGVDEVYCGVFTDRWLDTFSNTASPNRLHHVSGNLRDFQELEAAVECAHLHKVKIYLALNECYSRAQQYLLHKELESILKTDVDGLIVADIGLLGLLQGLGTGKEIHASNLLAAFNSESIRVLQALGATRTILPRDLTLDEIRSFVQGHSPMQFEVFVMNGGCRNIDGFCTHMHGIFDLQSSHLRRLLVSSSLSSRLIEVLIKLPSGAQRVFMNILGSRICSTACSLNYQNTGAGTVHEAQKPDVMSDLFSCGGCATFDFLKWGVASLKIVGRTFPLRQKIKDVAYVRNLIGRASQNDLSSDEFKDFSRNLYRSIYGRACREKCYYHG